MAVDIEKLVEDHSEPSHGPAGDGTPPGGRRRRKAWKVLAIVVGVVIALLAAAVAVFVLGREEAAELTADQALEDFRASGGASAGSDVEGLPAVGVYAATASGTESIGLPGFDEELGPRAPVTVTHGDGGCWNYRVDFNSHHWRSWTFCPTATATFAVSQVDSWTARKAPGLDIATLSTFGCDEPFDVLWEGAAAGDRRSGSCTGTTDSDDTVTADSAEVEVLGRGTLRVGGEVVDVVRVRTTETFGGDQTGSEVDEWWLDAANGLPVKLVIDSHVNGASEYTENAQLVLSTVTPAS